MANSVKNLHKHRFLGMKNNYIQYCNTHVLNKFLWCEKLKTKSTFIKNCKKKSIKVEETIKKKSIFVKNHNLFTDFK